MLLPPASVATAHNIFVGAFIVARFKTHRGLAPGCLRLTADGGAPFTTTMRMVTRVHHGATHRRTAAHMTRSSALADAAVLVIDIAPRPLHSHPPHLHPSLPPPSQP